MNLRRHMCSDRHIGTGILSSLFLFLTFACGPSIPIGAKRAAQEDDIREAVFRYQFAQNASGQQQNARVYCLSAGSAVLSDAFMKRFEGHKPRVIRAPQCATHGPNGVWDRETGESGLIFNVTEIFWISEDTAEVDGGYYEGNMSASGNSYRVARTRGRWTVKGDTMHWIS